MKFKPGMAVNIIFETDFLVNTTRVLKATIFDVIDDKLIVSQTSPPILRSSLNRSIQISFITHVESQPARFAASAIVTNFIANYEMSSSLTVPALILEQKTDLEEVNIRMFFRVKSVVGSNIVVLFGPEKLNLIDISLGGAKFSHPKPNLVQPRQELNLIFVFDGRRFEVKAIVLRIWSNADADTPKPIQYLSIQFEPGQREFEYYLGKKIMMMERQIIADGRV
jgi:hypothetical protein